jgi:hypothetical protein
MSGGEIHLNLMATPFDLNAALENWRAELAAQSALTPDAQRELETHLRDTFAELKLRGLNEEESFWLARRRVGQPQKLAEEFVKADPMQIWRERVFWMTASVIGYFVWIGLYSGVYDILAASSHPDYPKGTAFHLVRGLYLTLPFVLAITMMTSAWFCGFLNKISSFLNTATRLATCITLLVTGSCLFGSWGMWRNLMRVTGVTAPSGLIQILCMQLIQEIIPFSLTILLVRLFLKRKTRLPAHP